MKTLILTTLLTLSTLANAGGYYFTPHYENFAYDVISAKDTVKRVKRGRRTINKKAVRIKVNAGVASCGLLPIPLFIKYKKKIVSCSPEELVVNIQYKRTEACDQEMVMDGKAFKIVLPKDCDFSAKTGVVTIDRSN